MPSKSVCLLLLSVECLNLESLTFVTSGEVSAVANVLLGNPETHKLLLPEVKFEFVTVNNMVKKEERSPLT
jgi:hypothetical protein